MYEITDYTKRQAKRLGVDVRVSQRKNKKLDVFRDGKYIISIGDSRYSDFPTYMRTHGAKYAMERRRLYHERHGSNHAKDSAGFFASVLLW